MKQGTLILLALLFLNSNLVSQEKTDSKVEYKVQGHRIESEIKIDGKLDEAEWANAKSVSGFTNFQPTPGIAPKDQSVVKMLYDDNAIYLGAYLFEKSRDDISVQLSQRDQLGNTDWFGLIIDTYGNAQDALEFILGASGVQFDAKISNNGEDSNWDAVWTSNVHLTNNGWYAEIRIPYSAIRFPKAKVQEWNINFIRKDNKTQDKSSWFPIDPTQGVWLSQMGQTEGITDIKPPLRLSISPYVSVYALHQSAGDNSSTSTGYSYNGGMDLKYGINDAFTLDMTLIPDFGQVQSDDQVLNLTPFELQFDEQRQFFTEGTELFSKGELFYSRRVGGAPIGMHDVENEVNPGETLLDNPQKSKLLNATKISGRTDGGLGIGVFNGLANASYAIAYHSETGMERKLLSAPLTNYNVFVLDQNLKNNSTVSLVNTNVTRFGDSHYDANVTGTQFNFKDKKQAWSLWGEGAVSQKYYTERDNEYGVKYEAGIRNISGKLRYGIDFEQVGENFDPNDLGFQRYSNVRETEFHVVYSEYDTFGIFNRGNFWLNYSYNSIINPNEYSGMHFNTGFWMQTKNFIEYNLWSNFEPKTKDFFEPRVWGRVYEENSWANVGIYVGSDDRKKLRMSVIISYQDYHEHNRDGIFIELNPEWQVNDKLEFDFEVDYDFGRRHPRFVTMQGDDIIFGRRNRTTVTNSFSAAYTFTDKMSLDLRIRNYWSKVNYQGFHLLEEDGSLGETDYNEFNDFTFGLFNLDLNYRWRFAPGSDLIINWKNNISGVVNDKAFDFAERTYFNDVSSLKTFPENNSISVRLVYYLDFQQASHILRKM